MVPRELVGSCQDVGVEGGSQKGEEWGKGMSTKQRGWFSKVNLLVLIKKTKTNNFLRRKIPFSKFFRSHDIVIFFSKNLAVYLT